MPDNNVSIRRIISTPENIRNAIHQKVIEAIKGKFPIETDKFVADVSNLEAKIDVLTSNEEKKLLMTKGTKTTGIYGDITVTDKATGKVAGTLKKHRIVSIPTYTNRYTMIVDGNEYAVISQMRTKSGVYTRKRGNDTIESAFNLAKGANFRLEMDPDTGIFKIDILGSSILAIAVLKILRAAPNDIQQAIGKELYEKNLSMLSDAQLARARNFLYSKLATYHKPYEMTEEEAIDNTSNDEKDSRIRAYFSNTSIDPETTKITLGIAQTSVSASTLLIAMKKIIAVYKGDSDIDERDHLEFQKILGVEDLLKEVIDKNRDIVPDIKKGLSKFNPSSKDASKELKLAFASTTFSAPIHRFLTTSPLSQLPSQINPLEFIDTASKITRLGEGAISSERSVPFSTRAVTYSSIGLTDPIAAPESSKVGIDVHATMSAAKGSDNEFYKELRDCKTGKMGYHRAIDLYDKKVGFPDPGYVKEKKPTDKVHAVYQGKLIRCQRKDLDYQVNSPTDLCTYTTNTIPFMPANQGNRLLMGDKHVQQALPLEDPDVRLVKPVLKDNRFQSIAKQLGQYTIPYAKKAGTIAKITDDYICIKNDEDGKMQYVEYDKNLPLASKTFLNNDIIVKVGDHVEKNQQLAKSNFSKNGEFTTGKNLTVAYMAWKGLNHEDGVVLSEAAAQKMRSVHADKVFLQLTKNVITGKDKYVAAFPTNFTKEQLETIDSNGLVKKGTSVKQGDPLILAMENSSDNRVNQVLGKLNKALMHPYSDLAEIYDQPYQAEVTDTSASYNMLTVVLCIHRPMQIGDKIAGSYGNKGVCAAIIPTDQMPRDESGEPVDAILTPAGVPSRINPAQILESTLGKIAKRTGKPYEIENYFTNDYVSFVKNELKKHNMHDKETLTDPVTGKKIPGVFVGVQHMNKLFKTSDTNFSARGIEGGYDQDETPSGSGDTGPKGEGGMEINALLASNTRALLQEGTVLRGSKNADFWKAFQEGRAPNFPMEKKTFNRFIATLKQAGINVTRQGNDLVAAPLTDADITKMSNGVVKNGLRITAKDLKPEAGGLFDVNVFGGLQGDRWGHINLVEPVVNPVFFDAARNLLGKSTNEFEDMCVQEGGAEIKKKLNALDITAELKKAEDSLRDHAIKKTDVDQYVKRVKYLRALKKEGLKAGDAYVLSKFPVIPPIMRPISIGATGDIKHAPADDLYMNLVEFNNSFKKANAINLGKETLLENRKALNQRVREVVGTVAPESAFYRNRNIKGALQFIAGQTPKTGYFYKKIIYSRMNLTGRATVSPDTSLGLDEIGLPVDMAWNMYKPFIVREMAHMGYTTTDAKDAIEERSELATKILEQEMEKRPVIMNRAPTLWRHGMIAAKPLLREGTNVRVNSIWEKGLNMDYDGDAVNLHLPISEAAIEETKKLFPSHQVFSDKKRNSIIQMPSNEPIVGLYKATTNVGKAKPAGARVQKFPNEEAAWKAYYAGTLKLTDYVEIPQ